MAADEMERSRAVRAILKDARKYDTQSQDQEEMNAFMAIFHPDHEVPQLTKEN